MPTVGLCPIGRPYGDWGSQWTGQASEWPTWPFTGLFSPAPVWETCILGWRQGKALMWVWWFSLPTYPHGQPQPPLCQMPWSQGPSQFTFQWETLYLTPTTCQALGLCQRSHTTPFFGRKRRWTEREMTCPRPDGGAGAALGQGEPSPWPQPAHSGPLPSLCEWLSFPSPVSFSPPLMANNRVKMFSVNYTDCTKESLEYSAHIG